MESSASCGACGRAQKSGTSNRTESIRSITAHQLFGLVQTLDDDSYTLDGAPLTNVRAGSSALRIATALTPGVASSAAMGVGNGLRAGEAPGETHTLCSCASKRRSPWSGASCT